MKNFDMKKVLLTTVGLSVAVNVFLLIAIPVVHIVRFRMAGRVMCVQFEPGGSQKALYGAEKCFKNP